MSVKCNYCAVSNVNTIESLERYLIVDCVCVSGNRARYKNIGDGRHCNEKSAIAIIQKIQTPTAGEWWTDFICQNCGKKYNRHQNLQRHQKLECGIEKTLLCKFCPKAYWHKFALKNHLHQVHKVPKLLLPQVLKETEHSKPKRTISYEQDYLHSHNPWEFSAFFQKIIFSTTLRNESVFSEQLLSKIIYSILLLLRQLNRYTKFSTLLPNSNNRNGIINVKFLSMVQKLL